MLLGLVLQVTRSPEQRATLLANFAVWIVMRGSASAQLPGNEGPERISPSRSTAWLIEPTECANCANFMVFSGHGPFHLWPVATSATFSTVIFD
jgi:hypothetical protein